MGIAAEGRLMLDAVTATGASSEVLLDYPATQHTFTIELTDDDNDSISAVSVAMEGRLNANSGWLNVATHNMRAAEIAADGCVFAVVNRPFKRVRANVTTLTGEDLSDNLTVYYQEGGK